MEGQSEAAQTQPMQRRKHVGVKITKKKARKRKQEEKKRKVHSKNDGLRCAYSLAGIACGAMRVLGGQQDVP